MTTYSKTFTRTLSRKSGVIAMSETDTLKGKVSHLEAELTKAKEEWSMKDQQLEQLDVKVQQMNAMFK